MTYQIQQKAAGGIYINAILSPGKEKKKRKGKQPEKSGG